MKKSRKALEYLNTSYNRLYRFQEEELDLFLLTAQVQRCEKLEQIAKELKSKVIFDTCCMIEKEYLDEKLNPMQQANTSLADKELVVVFDSDFAGETFVPYTISPSEVTPHVDYLLEHENMTGAQFAACMEGKEIGESSATALLDEFGENEE